MFLYAITIKRHNCTKYVPPDIIKLCALFLFDDDNPLNDIKKLREKDIDFDPDIDCNMLKMSVFKCRIDISSRKWGIDSLDWRLYYFHCPIIRSVLFHYKMVCKELNFVQQGLIGNSYCKYDDTPSIQH